MMPAVNDRQIEALAQSCVNDMGDIFWDFDPARDAAGQYSDPESVALESVRKTLRELAEQFDTSDVYRASLRDEYKSVTSGLGVSPTDERVREVLVRHSDWTERGAQAVLSLAKQYGTFVLANALALAEALDIEDGEAGL